jgi:hypothetical protein
MVEPVEFLPRVTLTRDEVLEVVARCEDVVEAAEAAGHAEIGFAIEGVRRFLLGRLTGDEGGVDD